MAPLEGIYSSSTHRVGRVLDFMGGAIRVEIEMPADMTLVDLDLTLAHTEDLGDVDAHSEVRLTMSRSERAVG